MAESRVSILVIGAGVIGASLAFQFARRGVHDLVVLDRAPLPGSGSTSRANGGIRAQFGTPINIGMSLRSMRILDDLAPEIGEPPVYRKSGYLFFTARRERLARMREAVTLQRSLGVSVVEYSADEVRRRLPWVAGADLVGGTFGERDGFIDPGALTAFFVRQATGLGALLRCGETVVGIERSSAGELRVRTTCGAWVSPVVIDAAGPWAGEVARLAGVTIPIAPVRRHLLLSGPCSALPPTIPMTIDADTGLVLRREGPRVLIAWSNPDEPVGFDTSCDLAFAERIAEPLERRFPAVAAAGIDIQRSWAGLYEVTPDHHALLGPVDELPGFWLASGFSGHGIMHAPAAGECLAQAILGGATSVDIAALSPSRFARGKAIHETMVL